MYIYIYISHVSSGFFRTSSSISQPQKKISRDSRKAPLARAVLQTSVPTENLQKFLRICGLKKKITPDIFSPYKNFCEFPGPHVFWACIFFFGWGEKSGSHQMLRPELLRPAFRQRGITTFIEKVQLRKTRRCPGCFWGFLLGMTPPQPQLNQGNFQINQVRKIHLLMKKISRFSGLGYKSGIFCYTLLYWDYFINHKDPYFSPPG